MAIVMEHRYAITCKGSYRETELDLFSLPTAAPLDWIFARLHCQACGQRGRPWITVQARSRPPWAPTPDWVWRKYGGG